MTPAEYLDLDRHLPTCELMSDGEIVKLMSDSAKQSTESSEEHKGEGKDIGLQSPPISHCKADASIDSDVLF
mgnify:CR=1 FL=1